MDLRPFLDQLSKINEIETVKGADWDLEIGAIAELSSERKGKALLFEAIKGYPPGFRVLANLTATPRRLGAAFGFPPDISNIELVRLIKDTFTNVKPVPPAYLRDGPVLQNISEAEDVDLLRFPAPRWHEQDGGRYLGTGDMVIMRDPVGNWVNVGTYRSELYDRDTLGLYIEPGHHGHMIREAYWSQGKSCPVAIVFGAHPLVWLASPTAFPWGAEEFGIAGGLLGEPLQVITGQYTGLPIPAHAELAIEGECPPPRIESRPEGPFGEWTGYYGSGVSDEAVVKVKRVMHRNDPIITGVPPLRPPATGSGSYMIRAGNIWYELERLGIPGIKGVWNMRSGGDKYLNVISIEQKYAGHAKQVAIAAASGTGGAFHGRFVIVVDEDIDPSNDEDVLWAMATRCDPATSIEIIHGCWSARIDPTIPPEQKAKGNLVNSRALLLACRPYHWRKEFPRVNRASDELRAATIARWPDLFAANP